MDKRSLLFVVALSFTLFAVNYFFTYQSQETNKQWIEQQQTRKIEQQKKLGADIAERTAKSSDLPLVDVYGDHAATQHLATAIRDDNSLLVLAWTDPMPASVFNKRENIMP